MQITEVAVDSGPRFVRRICAASLLPFLLVPAIAGFGSASDVRRMALGLLAWASAVHVASGFAYYADRDARDLIGSDRRRYLLAPTAMIALFGFAGLIGMWRGAAVQIGIVAFTLWQIHHFTRQNYGVMVLFTKARRQPRPSKTEQTMLGWSGNAAILMTPRLMSSTGWTRLLIPAAVTDAAAVAGALVMVSVLVLFARHLLDPGRDQDRLRLALVGGLVAAYLPMFLLRDPVVALAAYATAHSFQYLVILWSLREGREQPEDRARFVAVLVALAVIGGVVIRLIRTVHGPDGLNGMLFGVSYGITLWHITLDAGVWKLSKAPSREYMQRRFVFLR